jgi:uncharacterized protein involved in exopolysaccharide biosynthesis
MNESQPGAVVADDGYSIAEITNLLRNQKGLVIAIITATALAALVIALVTKPVFRAQAVVMDVRERGGMSAGAIGGQLGGLAALAGMNLGSAGVPREANAVLKSRALASHFVEREALLPRLLEGQSGNATLWFAVERLRNDVLSIVEEPRSGLITVTVDWRDPDEAARWANAFIALADDTLRRRAIEDHERNIKYLNEQISQTAATQVKSVLFKIIEDETKNLMLARSRQDYAFFVVDSAVVPESRIAPRRTLIVCLGVALGVLLATLTAFARDAISGGRFRRRR